MRSEQVAQFFIQPYTENLQGQINSTTSACPYAANAPDPPKSWWILLNLFQFSCTRGALTLELVSRSGLANAE